MRIQWNGFKCDVAAARLQIKQNSHCCLIVPHTESQWAAFHAPDANARHNTVLRNTNTHRSGLDQNAISMLCSRGHRIYTVTSLHLMLGEPSAAQSERFGGFLCSWRSIKNSIFNFLYTSSTLKHHHSSHVHAVFFFGTVHKTLQSQVWMAASFMHDGTNIRAHAPLVPEHLQLCWAGIFWSQKLSLSMACAASNTPSNSISLRKIV